MVARIDANELQLAWLALDGLASKPGWMTIPLGRLGPRYRAGVVYPERYETLLVGFDEAAVVRKEELPVGRGFQVQLVPGVQIGALSFWLGVSRQPGAPLDMFAMMAADIIASTADQPHRSEAWLANLMLARIRAWQEFMRPPRAGVLSAEAELGLVGELMVLECMLDSGADASAVVTAWQGPSGGARDFQTAVHGIEVKTTLAARTFRAHISSLEQLDPVSGVVILLVGVRLCLQECGQSLPYIIRSLRARLAASPFALPIFELQLLKAGYFDDAEAEYVRQFANVAMMVYDLHPGFPRIVRSTTPVEITSAEYEIDLDLVVTPTSTLSEALVEHGVF